jgi:hypothetical protein
MIGNQGKKSRASERGVALVVALLVLLLLSTLIAGMIVMSNTETNISSNFRDEQTAFFAARAGIEEVRDRFRPAAPGSLSTFLPVTALPGGVNGVVYVVNPAAGEIVTPWLATGNNYPDDEICKEVTCTAGLPTGTWYVTPAQSANASYAPAPILTWKWVRVMAKANKSDTGIIRVTSVDGTTNGNRVCWNGSNEHATAAASCPDKTVFELTALAVTRSGSRRMIQYEVSQNTLPSLPGAMIFDGPGPTYGAPNSNAFNVNGNDAHSGPSGAGCSSPASNKAALGAFDSSSVSTLANDSTVQKRAGSYTGSSGSTPDVQNVNSALGALNNVDGLQALVNNVTSAADPANVYNSNNPSISQMGTNGTPVINVVKGDLSLGGGSSGAGILLVTGTLTLSGNPSYNGIILVIGKGVVQKNGGGNGTLSGSLFVANMNDSKGNPIALGYGNAPGAPTINWNGGGNATIQYDSCWINAVTQAFPYTTLAQRELIY